MQIEGSSSFRLQVISTPDPRTGTTLSTAVTLSLLAPPMQTRISICPGDQTLDCGQSSPTLLPGPSVIYSSNIKYFQPKI